MKKLIIIIGLFLSILKGNSQTKYVIITQKNGGFMNDTIQVDSAANIRVVFKIDIGYRLDSVFVDGNKISKDSINGYTFYNVVSNHIIQLILFKTYRLITIENGSISPINIQVKPDTTIRFSYTPDSGYIFDYVIANGVINRDSTTNFTLKNISVNSRLGVYFKPIVNTITFTKKYKSINKVDSVVTNIYPDIKKIISLIKYTITTSINNGTITPSTTIDSNASLTLQFNASAGYRIDSVKVGNIITQIFNGQNRPSNGTYTIKNIKGDSSVKVFTSVVKYNVTTFIYNGEITPSITADSNSIIILQFNTSAGFRIDSIQVGNIITQRYYGQNRPSIASYTIQNISTDSSVQVFTSLVKYTITTSIINGTITPSTTIDSNASLTLQFNASAGFRIDSIQVGNIITQRYYGQNRPSIASYIIQNISADSSIQVFTSLVKYTITTSINNGTITPSTTIDSNANLTISFTANDGYKISSIMLNGVETLTDTNQLGGSVILDAIYSDNNIVVSTKLITQGLVKQYYINTFISNGRISPRSLADSNASFTLQFNANAGYRIDSIKINNIITQIFNAPNRPTNGTYTFQSISGDSTIQVFTSLVKYRITTSIDSGSITPTSFADSNGSITLQFNANKGFRIDSVKVGTKITKIYYVQNRPSNATYTIQNIRGDSNVRVFTSLVKYNVITFINNGQITPSTLVDTNASFSLQFNTTAGYRIDSIKINNIITQIFNVGNRPTNGAYTFQNMRGDSTIQVFTSTYTITTSINNGFITPTSKADSAASLTLQFNTSAGFRIDSIQINNQTTQVFNAPNRPSNGSYTFQNINGDSSIQVFTSKYTITTSINNGFITPSLKADSNASIPLQFNTNAGFRIDSIKVNNIITKIYNPQNRPSNDSYTIQNISGDSNIQVFTSLVKYNITSSITNANGIITPNISTADSNSNPTINIYANTGYRIDSIQVTNKPTQKYTILNRPINVDYTIQNINADANIRVFTSLVKFAIRLVIVTPTTRFNTSNIRIDTLTDNTFEIVAANIGYRIDSLKVGNVVTQNYAGFNTTDTFYTIRNIQADSVVQVFTSLIRYNIITSIQNGTITPTNGVDSNSTNKIDFYTNEGYIIDSVKVNGKQIDSTRFIGYDSTTGSYTFNNVRGDSTIAVFTSIPKTLKFRNLYANMLTVPAGTFTMGYTPKQQQNNGDGTTSSFTIPPTQQVTLSTYKICRYEVTQQLWKDVMGTNPSFFNDSNTTGINLQRPVESVSWNDCQTFITRLNQLTGLNYKLPTEAEWEYAARGGNDSDSYFYSGSDSVNWVARWVNNSYTKFEFSSTPRLATHTVGTRMPNQLGLYDMSGNVYEWCYDVYGNYSNTPITNPTGPIINKDTFHIIRGGSYDASSNFLRNSSRARKLSTVKQINIGFRLALVSTRYNVTVKTIANRDTASTNYTLEQNQSLIITFNARSGYRIDSIKVGNTVTLRYDSANRPSSGTYTIQNIRGDSNVWVFTSLVKYTIATSIANGTITDTTLVDSNTNRTISFIPKAGYVITSVTINGSIINNSSYVGYDSTAGFYTFKNIKAGAIIAVTCDTPTALNLQSLAAYMITIRGDSFMMGCTRQQAGFGCSADEYPAHKVTLSTYKLCKLEVTQQLWKDVMGTNPSYSSIYKNLQLPVENVSWDDCQNFITRLNQLTGMNYRMPTEAEWEYAARGGNNRDSFYFSGSDSLNLVGWYYGNSLRQNPTFTIFSQLIYLISPVGGKQANRLGIYDMSGNVNEWCYDTYLGYYYPTAVTNPVITNGYDRVYRGGAYHISYSINQCRVSARNHHSSNTNSLYIGLRLAQ